MAFILILVVQMGAGAYFMYDGLTAPFSESKNVATYISDNHLNNLPVYGSYHYCMTGISGYLNKPVIHIDDMQPYTYMPWQKLKVSHEAQSDSFLMRRLPVIQAAHDSSLLVLTYVSPLLDTMVNSHVRLLQSFNNGNEYLENYNVYLIKR
jgi:hypothetical protein